MHRRWWQRGWFWAGVLSGLFFAAVALFAAHYLDWRGEAHLWIGLFAFLAGASFEWLQLGARRYAALTAVVVSAGLGWQLIPERVRARVDWLAPVRNTAPALERVHIDEIVLPNPSAPSATQGESGRAPGSRAGRPASYTIEVHNAEDESLELNYSTASGERYLGRIPGGAIQRFSISGVAGGTIQLRATGAGDASGDTIRRAIRLDTDAPVRITLRRG